MNTLSEEDLELLDRLIRNELDPTETEAVELRISTHPAWQDAYLLRKAARAAGRKIVHENLRNRFTRIDRGGGNLKVSSIWLAVAAGGALLISALLWFFPSASSSEDLMADYAKFPNIVLPIQKSGGDFSTRERAYQAYEMNDFSQSIAYFNSVDTLETSDSLFLALAFLESEQLNEANTLFIHVERTTDTRWSQVAQWYRVWTLIRLNRKSEAQKILVQIADTADHRYRDAAPALLKKF